MNLRKIISIILVLVISISLVACGEVEEDDNLGAELTVEEKINNSELLYPSYNENFKYDVYTYYIKIREYIGNSSEIVIPDTIEKRTVLSIEENAFYKDYDSEEYKGPKITKVILPNSIIKIGNGAFSNSIYLKEITFPESVETIGDSAFEGCTSLRKITIPKSIYNIGANAFIDCENITSVTIEEETPINDLGEINVTENTEGGRAICSGAFANCKNLKAIWIPADILSIEDGALDDGATNPNLTIYGYGQTRIAYYASTYLLKFQVLDKEKFDILADELIKQTTTTLSSEVNSSETNTNVANIPVSDSAKTVTTIIKTN